MLRIERDLLAEAQASPGENGLRREARIAGGKNRPPAGQRYAMGARQMKCVETNFQE